jgi:5,10-methylene-tetrahydrofolate dehydrogenase/methenyl tetrahydrofolate cyclohydrolase
VFKNWRVVVVGRSRIVGIPVALELLENNATVQICHHKASDLSARCRVGAFSSAVWSQTEDLPSVVKRADIVVAGARRRVLRSLDAALLALTRYFSSGWPRSICQGQLD